jgi:NAD(P)H-nitrite reductase large subunit
MSQLSVRVGIKETEDPIPLCYCFNFDRKAVWDAIRSKGTTDIPRIVTRRIKAGECRCEVTNPRGSCCLGDIYRAVQQAEKNKKARGR